MPMPAHLEVTGQKQGKIDGSCEMQGREATILIEAFDHEVTIPRDIQSGLAVGKREHRPFKLVKIYDKSSPKLYQALVTGEHFTDVTVKWYRIDPSGHEEHYFTHKLEDAVLVSMRAYMPNCLDPQMEGFQHMEEIAFTYKKIRWTWEVDGIESEDSWLTPK